MFNYDFEVINIFFMKYNVLGLKKIVSLIFLEFYKIGLKFRIIYYFLNCKLH